MKLRFVKILIINCVHPCHGFKVYEDEEQRQQPPRGPKVVQNDPYNIYKEQIGNRFITKKELAEIEAKKPKPKKESPMSVEKCEAEQKNVESEIVARGGSSKDIFFEMEEYRDMIYQYLREHEVCFVGCLSWVC